MTADFTLRLAAVRERIAAAAARAGRGPEDITLLAVSKGHPLEAARAAYAAGMTDLGESRIQEALPKMAALKSASGGPGPAWHLIGHLQKNKAAKAIEAGFALIHSVNSVALAARLDRLAGERGVRQDVLLQVNISAEPQKHGIPPDGVTAALAELAALPHLRVRGLMGMAPQVDAAEQTRPYFRELAGLFARISGEAPDGVTMEVLSMGMSGDFEVAIEEGATIVRVGSALFGKRETTG